MDHLKSDECGGEGEGGEGNVQFTRTCFFFHRDKHEYFYSGAEIFIFFIVVDVFWKYTHHFLDFLQDIKSHSLHDVKFFTYKYLW